VPSIYSPIQNIIEYDQMHSLYIYDVVLRGGLYGNEGLGPSSMVLLYLKHVAKYLMVDNMGTSDGYQG